MKSACDDRGRIPRYAMSEFRAARSTSYVHASHPNALFRLLVHLLDELPHSVLTALHCLENAATGHPELAEQDKRRFIWMLPEKCGRCLIAEHMPEAIKPKRKARLCHLPKT